MNIVRKLVDSAYPRAVDEETRAYLLELKAMISKSLTRKHRAAAQASASAGNAIDDQAAQVTGFSIYDIPSKSNTLPSSELPFGTEDAPIGVPLPDSRW
jgi:hypothetical protein